MPYLPCIRYKSPRNNIHRHIEDLGDLQDRVDMTAGAAAMVVGPASLSGCRTRVRRS